MGIHSTAKTKIYIGTTTLKADAAAYAADAWTEIKEIEDIGEFGPEASEITFSSVGDGYVRRRKGVIDNGSLQLVCGRDPLDPGQQMARLAVEDELPYNFRVTLADKPTAAGKPTTYYFRAVVLTAKNTYGTGNDLTKVTFGIGVDGQILEVEAATA
jgi:hypothetical protein